MNHLIRLLAVASAAFFFASSALAQNAGTVTNHAFALGKGAGTTGYTSLLCTSAQLAVGQAAADPICRTVTGDVTITAAGVTAIGASKVTNAQLATMAANTTKCNATAGTTNPTDCTASTMKTNLGLVIGTNVQAWDTDLDCLAALSSTGVLSRTGGGTCSAGALALSGLATGTQDTVIGYFGSTTASALAINNCTGALTYSTGTHTFGCNATAGTGTVTSVVCGAGLVGGTITTSGTCAVSLSPTTISLAADVSLSNTANYFDGPSIAQGSTGTWFASGTVTVTESAAAAGIYCKLWDGTTVIASAAQRINSASQGVSISLSGFLSSPAGNLRISCRDITATTGKIVFNLTGNSTDSTISAFRIQ
jgi:hypothetical protein